MEQCSSALPARALSARERAATAKKRKGPAGTVIAKILLTLAIIAIVAAVAFRGRKPKRPLTRKRDHSRTLDTARCPDCGAFLAAGAVCKCRGDDPPR